MDTYQRRISQHCAKTQESDQSANTNKSGQCAKTNKSDQCAKAMGRQLGSRSGDPATALRLRDKDSNVATVPGRHSLNPATAPRPKNPATAARPKKPPRTVSNPSCDPLLVDHMQSIIQVWNTDAAADELLAGPQAPTWMPSSDAARPLLPNLRYVNRDCAHASRRVVKRPWFADEFFSF